MIYQVIFHIASDNSIQGSSLAQRSAPAWAVICGRSGKDGFSNLVSFQSYPMLGHKETGTGKIALMICARLLKPATTDRVHSRIELGIAARIGRGQVDQ
jgi:hypothetical protein